MRSYRTIPRMILCTFNISVREKTISEVSSRTEMSETAKKSQLANADQFQIRLARFNWGNHDESFTLHSFSASRHIRLAIPLFLRLRDPPPLLPQYTSKIDTSSSISIPILRYHTYPMSITCPTTGDVLCGNSGCIASARCCQQFQSGYACRTPYLSSTPLLTSGRDLCPEWYLPHCFGNYRLLLVRCSHSPLYSFTLTLVRGTGAFPTTARPCRDIIDPTCSINTCIRWYLTLPSCFT